MGKFKKLQEMIKKFDLFPANQFIRYQKST